MGDREVRDLDVAVAYARELGYRRIAAVGFSMGASIVIRYAGLIGGLDAAVSVSSPGRWFYRGTRPMRRVHWAAERRAGRLVTRTLLKTRVSPVPWDPEPVPPAEAAARVSPTPLLVVHGDKDLFFPVDHAQQIYDAARDPKELWLVPGFGHAESACHPGLIDRIGGWVTRAAGAGDAQPVTAAAGNGAASPAAAQGRCDAAAVAEQAAEAAGAAGPGYQPDGSGMPSV